MRSMVLLMVVIMFPAMACAADFPQFVAERLSNNPIITPQMFADAGVPDDGKNINGPSLIRVPDWIPPEKRADPKANYYLYFANHGGLYIRMAWAEKVEGPYTLYQPGKGVLSLTNEQAIKRPRGKGTLLVLADGLAIGGHIASPDVHVDDANKRIVMLFHGFEESHGEEGDHGFTGPDGKAWSRKSPQKTFGAVSEDGLDFNRGVHGRVLAGPYLRATQIDGKWYASAFGGILKANNPDDILSGYDKREGLNQSMNARHTAARVADNGDVTVFFSRFGGEPEHIEYITFRGVGKARSSKWETSEARSLLKPQFDWEGADLPVVKSEKGAAGGRVHQLRDPGYFRDRDGKEYVLYSVGGECGIAITQLTEVKPQ